MEASFDTPCIADAVVHIVLNSPKLALTHLIIIYKNTLKFIFAI